MNIKETLLETNYFIDNEYLDRYVELITNNLETVDEKFKTQKHHIVPRKCYKLLGCRDKKYIDREENLVNLLYKDHILAHYLLALAVKDCKYKLDCLNTVVMMTSVEVYKESLIKIASQLEELQKLYEEYKIEFGKKMTGHSTSEETKKKIGQSNKERYARVKHVYVHHMLDTGEFERKVVPETELNNYLESGWQLGRNDPECYKKISEAQKLNPNRSMLGRKQSEHQKEVMRKLMTGAKISDNAKKAMSQSHANKILISNNETQQSFYATIEDYENIYKQQGFYNGRLKRR